MSEQLRRLEEELRDRLYQCAPYELPKEAARLVLRAYALGQQSVRVGGCGAESEIRRLDSSPFPWDDTSWMDR